MTFGDKIRKLRIEKKMTQQKLGAMVGVSYRTIRAWEVDGRYPKQSSLYQKLADAFQCRVSYLMDDNETVCLGNDEPSEYSGAKQARQAFPEKIKELEMEGARILWDELTCVGYPVSEEATEKTLSGYRKVPEESRNVRTFCKERAADKLENFEAERGTASGNECLCVADIGLFFILQNTMCGIQGNRSCNVSG